MPKKWNHFFPKKWNHFLGKKWTIFCPKSGRRPVPLLSTPSATPEFHFQKHKNKKQTTASQHRRRPACRYNCFTRCGTDRKHQCETPIKKFCSTPMRDTDQNFLSDSVLRCTHQCEARVNFLCPIRHPAATLLPATDQNFMLLPGNTISNHGSKFPVRFGTPLQHHCQPRIKKSCLDSNLDSDLNIDSASPLPTPLRTAR